MKTQVIKKSGVLGLAVAVVLSMGGGTAFGISHTFSVESDIAIGAELPAIHPPVAGPILSATITISSSGIGQGPSGGDELVSFFIGNQFRGFLTPGQDLHVFQVLAGDLGLVASGLQLKFALEENNNTEPEAFGVIHTSTLNVETRPESFPTPDAGSTLLLLGAGLTALGTLKRRLS